MKTIGLIIAMLFSVTSWGATPASAPGIQTGGTQTNNRKTTFTHTIPGDMSRYNRVLFCVWTGANASACDVITGDDTVQTSPAEPEINPNVLQAYVVPTGKKFTVHHIEVIEDGTGPCRFNIGACNSGGTWGPSTGFDTGDPCATGGVAVSHRYVGNGIASVDRMVDIDPGDNFVRTLWPRFVVPAGEVPFAYCAFGTADISMYMYGIEEDI